MKINRLLWVDALRGLAIVMMVVFHFCYNLWYFNLVDVDFKQDAFWLSFRTTILSLFLFVTGISVWLSHQQHIKWTRVNHRLFILLFNAFLISLVTWFLFGDRYIYFGVLHFIAVASLLALIFVRFYWLTLAVAILLLLLGQAEFSWFDSHRWRHVVGLMTHKPYTEDYVPLLPWLGVVLLGMFFIKTLHPLLNQTRSHLADNQNILSQALGFMGRHSLVIYMLHQPLLFGGVWLFVTLR